MNFPSKIVENAVEQLSSLPGIGRKSALRLVLFMLKQVIFLMNLMNIIFNYQMALK